MEEETIKIKVKSIDNQECEFCVKKNTTAEELKNMIAEKKYVDANDIRLIYQGQCLSNTKTIAEYNIQNDHIIHAVIRKKENEKSSQFKNTDQDNNNNYTSSSNPLNDPLQYGFASNINFNNLNSNANTTDSNRPFGNTSIPTPNIGGTTPLYFTHMRLTRNDNLENDLMGQTNMCSLLNDIMSQVNINPNFIYGAATAAVNSAGSGENFFTANLRPTDTNTNMNDSRTNKEKDGTNANNTNNANSASKQKDMDKDEAQKENENVNNDAENNAEKGTNNDNCGNTNPEHNKQKNEKSINNKHSSEGKNKGKKSNSSSSSENSSRSNSSYEYNKNSKESDEDKKKLKKKLKKKYMQKLRNKYDDNSLNKENNNDDIYSSSYNSNYESSCSENSDTKEREIDEEKKRRYKNKILEKLRKKKEKKEKKKKKKYYYSTNSSSDYDKIYEKEEKKKKKKLRNKGKFMFDPNLLYNPNYMRNTYRGAYNPGYPNPYIANFNTGNAFRPNTNFNAVFNNNGMLRNGPYPYMNVNDMNRPMYYYDQKCGNISENENYINFKDDNSDGYEHMKKGLSKDFFKSSFKREELNVNDKKRMINTMNMNKNISDANNNNSETLFGSNFGNNNVHTGNRTMDNTQNLIKNSSDCYTGGILDGAGPQNSNNSTTNNNANNNRNSYANIIPFSDVELVRNHSARTNSRGTLNHGEDDLSENNLMPEHMRSIQMASNNRRHLRSTSKLLNEENDFEYKNIELNIPWRIMEQLLVLLEEETGYKKPNLSSYINSYYNTNSIYVFFNLFVHINNVINSIIIQFNHSNFLNNDIPMSSFSRISIILSLASVIFSRLSNFFFVFYDNFYCNNYGRSYRYSEPINHEYLRELRNFYYSNNRNNNMRYSNIANFNSEQNNTYDNFRRNTNRTNLQQEFEDYYKNYLSGIDVGIDNNLLLRRDHTNFKTENLTDNIFSKDDYINHKFKNKRKSSNSFIDPKENKYNNHKYTDLKGSLRTNRDWNTNNPFSTLQNYNKNNDPLLYISKTKKKGNKKNEDKQKKNEKDTNSASANKNPSVCSSKHSRSVSSNKVDSCKNESENKNIVEPNAVDSSTKRPKDKGNFMINIFKNLLKNESEEKTTENNINDQDFLKNNEKKNNNCPNTTLVCYDNNMDEMYETSNDEKKQKDSPQNNEPNKMGQQNSTNTPLSAEPNEKRENDGKPNAEKNNSVGTQKNEKAVANNASIPNINFANILNNVQNQLATHKAPEAPQRDKFDGVPDKVKERYANWTENTQIFSGQMIKICRNKRPLSYTYLGESSLNEDISYNNPLPFLWKKNMSNINASFDLEVSDELIEAFDMHILEFVKKSIKNNEDYKLEKSKYPSLSKCEELFDEADKN
ncbi:ubiquitin-like protein, putative [Plasmodium chabaudi chabaudi]|uniref:Ubiquitin-like protein, putative n=1 Tax=Plasmodium chabaudi chabaudi TaxID=31271 RepID=A0A1D3RUE0_PLACU|nr:ubiquitin-like protein, putative [Plasmodium chabaudi chabaudi]